MIKIMIRGWFYIS